MAWTHPISRQRPLMPDESQCRRCGLAFIVNGPRKTYCSPECSAKPTKDPATAARRRQADRIRGTSAARGYGYAHRQKREKALPYAYGSTCAYCGAVMQEGQKLDLDHLYELARGGPIDGPVRFLHSSCNRSRGAVFRNRRATNRWL